MTRHFYLAILLFVLLNRVFCDATFQPPNPLRGHKEPFGHQVHQYKRIRTIYENPHPEEFYSEYFRKSQPVIIRGGAKTWPAVKKWGNLTYIAEQSGDQLNLVTWKRGYAHDKYHPVILEMTMKEFTEQYEKKNLYLDTTVPSGIQQDIFWPRELGCRFYTRRLKQLAVLFNGGKSSCDIHQDTADTYFVQITGQRQWLLIHPDYAHLLYAETPHLPYHGGISVMDQKAIDMEKYGDLINAEIYGGMLYPGDLIFVPETWFHQVRTFGSPNMAVVAFFNFLRCNRQDFDDLDGMENLLRYCLRFLDTKPRTLKCQAMESNLTADKLPPFLGELNEDALTSISRNKSTGAIVQTRFLHNLNTGYQFYPLGVDLTDLGKSVEELGDLIRRALQEGYRMFSVRPGDHSEEAVRRYVKYEGRLPRKKYRIIMFLPVDKFGTAETTKALDNSLKTMNTTFINAVIMEAPYCKSSNTSTCDRNDFNSKWLETWKVMEEYKRNKKILSLGVSDFSIQEIQTLVADAKEPISIIRSRFDIFFRNIALRKYAKQLNAVFMAHSINGEAWTKHDGATINPVLNHFLIHAMSYFHRFSLHASSYHWAIRKHILVCAREFSPDEVRIAWLALVTIPTVSTTGKYVYKIDKLVEQDDHTFLRKDEASEEVSSSRHELYHKPEKPVDNKHANPDYIIDSYTLLFQSKGRLIVSKRDMEFNHKNYSDEVYTDDKDFEETPLHN